MGLSHSAVCGIMGVVVFTVKQPSLRQTDEVMSYTFIPSSLSDSLLEVTGEQMKCIITLNDGVVFLCGNTWGKVRTPPS